VTSRSFRRDIEGLRAVAVALVVLYHAGATWVPGGYIGVDVFFVVSGFLITGLLTAELHERGRISLGAFYARRVRRLLPASVVVLVSTVALMKAIAPPLSSLQVRGDAIATALYASNLRFASVATDYFAGLEPSPLLHYWSLAVEEQFYLVWPLLLLGAALVPWGRLRVRLAVVVGAVLASSFALSLVLTPRRQPFAFFLLPSRAWELAAGAVLALGVDAVRRVPPPVRWAMTWTGLAGIAAAAVVFDERTMWPGHAAAVPVVATLLVIAGGAPSPLTVAPLQWLGSRSYTLYLWHWPLLVVPALGRPGSLPLPVSARVALVIAALVLAEVTSRTIENPIRTTRALATSVPRSVALGGALTGLAVVVGAVGGLLPALDAGRPAAAATSEETPFVPSNLRPALRAAASDQAEIQRNGCNSTIPNDDVNPCVYGDPHGDRTVVLFGDSHAAHWFPALEPIARTEGWRLVVLTKSGCPPEQVEVYMRHLGRQFFECDRWRSDALEVIAQEREPVVLMSASRALRPMDDDASFDDLLEDGLARTVDALPASAELVLVSDVPRADVNVPTCLSTHISDTSPCATPRSFAIDDDHRAAEAAAAERVGATLLDVVDWVCPGDPCAPIRGNLLVWRDEHHLSTPFAASLAPRLLAALRPLVS
jgi:peptidoglycan/LPS O-acetylase OafA/YrhL